MPTELLRVEKLASGYGRIPILFDIDLTLDSGAFVGILGHNGMGKTTLLRALMGHLPATAGRVLLDGSDITKEPAERRARRGIGYVPQGRQIFPALTVLENLAVAAVHLPRAEARRKVEEILEMLPRLQPIQSRSGGVLSGGEQQILALGRCLCGAPRLLLLDEPTEGVQPSICDEILELLQSIARSRAMAILLVEQDMDFVRRLADHVLIIRKGRLGETLDPSALDDAETARAFVGLGA